MQQFTRYPKYKNSGVDWLGKIPEGWDVRKVRRIATVVNGSTPSSSVEKYWGGEITWITPTDINNIKEITNSERTLTQLGYSNCGSSIVPKGSLILTTRAPIGKSTIAGKKLCTNQGCKSLVFQIQTNSFYINYFFTISSAILNSMGTGTTFMELGNTGLKDFIIPFPPFSEQNVIAAFLDEKTTKIDNAIVQKEKMIALLKERKQIMIQNAVTKGLDPNAKMKNSGVEWIGEIPEGWEIKKLKYLATYFKGYAFRSESYRTNGIPIIKAGNIKETSITAADCYIDPNEFKSEYKAVELKTGDIIVSTVGSKPDVVNSAVGQLAQINDFYNGALLNQNTVCIRPNGLINRDFMKCCFLSSYMNFRFRSISLWIANQAYIEVDNILNSSIALPSISEQTQIVNFINVQSEKIDKTIGVQEKQIDKLKEYKTVLIDSAVTGKIKVC